jgi:hypothetical protein
VLRVAQKIMVRNAPTLGDLRASSRLACGVHTIPGDINRTASILC